MDRPEDRSHLAVFPEPGGDAEEAVDDAEESAPDAGSTGEMQPLGPSPDEKRPAEGEPSVAPRRIRRVPAWYDRLPRRGRIGLWAAFLAWALLGVALFGDWGRILPGGGPNGEGAKPEPDLVLAVVRPDPPAQPAFSLLHRGTSGSGLLLLPAGTIVEVPGLGPRSLTATLEGGGPDLVATSVANVLGTRVPQTLVATSADVRSLVDALGGVTVRVPERITVVEGGFQRSLFEEGAQSLSAEEFLRFLTLAVPDQKELERVARQNAAWRGLLVRLAERGRGGSVRAALDGWDGQVSGDDATRVLSALASDRSLAISTLPVTRVGVSQADLYDVDRRQLPDVRRAFRDVATVGSFEGRRVRLLVGADGAIGPSVARTLVENGFVIVLSGKASEPYDLSRVVLAEDTDALRQTGRRLIALLGTGRLGLSRAPQTLVDVTLVVGRDWAIAHGFPQAPRTPAPTTKPQRGRSRTGR